MLCFKVATAEGLQATNKQKYKRINKIAESLIVIAIIDN